MESEARLKLEIGARVNELRRRRGESMDAFAAEIGSTSATVSNIENGKSIPGGAILINISKVCNVSIDWILKGDAPNDAELNENTGRHIFFRNQWLIYSQNSSGYMSEVDTRTLDAVFLLLENVQQLSNQDIELLGSVAARIKKESE